MKSIKVSIIGVGNVGFHLVKALSDNGVIINQVFSRNLNNAILLEEMSNINIVNSLTELKNNSDVYVIAVPDDSINEVLSKLNLPNKLIVHTSGSVSIDVFKDFSLKNYGVFYPLQSFSKSKTMDISSVPFCLEANDTDSLETLSLLAKSISNHVFHISSKQREILHLAAVFANNFSNHMYQIAYDISNKHDIPFEILIPLIKETANKIETLSPIDAQTGPAIRNDKETIDKHLKHLKNDDELSELYKIITKRISQNNK